MQPQQQQVMTSGMGAYPHESTLVYMPIPIRSKTYDRYHHKQSTALGTIQIIIGMLCIGCNGASIAMAIAGYDDTGLSYVGHGFWCGVLLILTGGFGAGAGSYKTKCPIVAFMVLCIISALSTVSLLAVGILGAILATDCGYDYGYSYNYPYYNLPCETTTGYIVVVAMEASMAVLGFIAGITAIWGSALGCCSGVCCCSQSDPSIVQQFGYNPNNGQIVYSNQTQMGPNYNQPQFMSRYSQGMTASPSQGANNAEHGWAVTQPNSTISETLNGQASATHHHPTTMRVFSVSTQWSDHGDL